MEGPAKVAEADGESGEGDVGIGARVAQAIGGLAEVGGHLGQQFGLVEVESLAQLEQQGSLFRGSGACGEAKARRGVAVEIGTRVDGED